MGQFFQQFSAFFQQFSAFFQQFSLSHLAAWLTGMKLSKLRGGGAGKLSMSMFLSLLWTALLGEYRAGGDFAGFCPHLFAGVCPLPPDLPEFDRLATDQSDV